MQWQVQFIFAYCIEGLELHAAIICHIYNTWLSPWVKG